MTHVRLYVHLFGFPFCLVAADVTTEAALAIAAGFQAITQHLPQVAGLFTLQEVPDAVGVTPVLTATNPTTGGA